MKLIGDLWEAGAGLQGEDPPTPPPALLAAPGTAAKWRWFGRGRSGFQIFLHIYTMIAFSGKLLRPRKEADRSISEKKEEMQSLMVSAKTSTYLDAFLGNLSPELK